MSDRDYIHPLLLFAAIGTDDHYHEWSEAGQPLLTPRASAVLAAVEDAMASDGACDGCDFRDDDCWTHDGLCGWSGIRRAWRGNA